MTSTYRARYTNSLQRNTLLKVSLSVLAALSCSAQATLVLTPASSVSTAATLGQPTGLAGDAAGNLYATDTARHRLLAYSPAGVLTVIAGTGSQGFAGDGVAATKAELNSPRGIAVATSGLLYVADTGNHRIRRIDLNGIIQTIAGTGTPGFAGDGKAAVQAQLRLPTGLALAANGDLYIADTGNHRIRRLALNGTLTTIAGNGEEGDTGDGGPATSAALQSVGNLAVLADGRVLLVDTAARRLRVLQTDGTIAAYSGPVPTLRRPAGISVDAAGNLFLADAASHRVLQLAADGASTLVGTGRQGALTAGAPLATALDSPAATVVTATGDVLVSDRRNHQLQRVQPGLLSFGTVPASQISQAQTLTLKNGGTATLTILTLDLTTGFIPQSSTCAATPFALAASAQCTVLIAFAPIAQGTQTGVATVHLQNAAPQSIALQGIASAGGALAASSVTLIGSGAIVYAGTPLLLTASTSGTLQSAPTGSVNFFDGTTLLGTAPAPAASLSIASLTSSAHSLHAVYLGDTVYRTSTSNIVTASVVTAPDFLFTADAASYSGRAGSSITINTTLQPMNGTLNHSALLTVVGLPTGTTATFSPIQPTLAASPQLVTLTLKLPASLALQRHTPLPLAAFALIAAIAFRRRTRLLLLLALCGCGGGYRGATTSTTTSAQTYTATLTATVTGATGSPLIHSTTVTLVLTP